MLDYKELTANIKKVFVESEKYQLDKHVPEFIKDGKYVGDFFSLTMFELDGDKPPIFYHTYSPYDIISGASSDYAAIFRSGELIMSTEFTPYMRQRTGSMTSLVLLGMGMSSLSSKKVLYIGTGNTACCDISALKANYPDLETVYYTNKSGLAAEFTRLASDIKVNAIKTDLSHIAEFDIIICHTSSNEPVLTSDIKRKLKKGAFIASFASEDHTEVTAEVFDTNEAMIIIDWEKTISEAVELNEAVDKGFADIDKIVMLKTLLSVGINDTEKQYTIYRSHGTPMQNLAALQLLLLNSQPSS